MRRRIGLSAVAVGVLGVIVLAVYFWPRSEDPHYMSKIPVPKLGEVIKYYQTKDEDFYVVAVDKNYQDLGLKLFENIATVWSDPRYTSQWFKVKVGDRELEPNHYAKNKEGVVRGGVFLGVTVTERDMEDGEAYVIKADHALPVSVKATEKSTTDIIYVRCAVWRDPYFSPDSLSSRPSP
jgi:hypothetical protein